MLLYGKSSLWGCYKPRHVTNRDVLLFATLRYLGFKKNSQLTRELISELFCHIVMTKTSNLPLTDLTVFWCKFIKSRKRNIEGFGFDMVFFGSSICPQQAVPQDLSPECSTLVRIYQVGIKTQKLKSIHILGTVLSIISLSTIPGIVQFKIPLKSTNSSV